MRSEEIWHANQDDQPGHITTGDIFDDLGFPPAETLEAKVKAEIWQALLSHIEQRGLTQRDLTTALKAHQPDVSNLLKGKISRISITRLIQYAGRLNLNARVTVTAPAPAAKGLLPSQSGFAAGLGAESAGRIADPLTA